MPQCSEGESGRRAGDLLCAGASAASCEVPSGAAPDPTVQVVARAERKARVVDPEEGRDAGDRRLINSVVVDPDFDASHALDRIRHREVRGFKWGTQRIIRRRVEAEI